MDYGAWKPARTESHAKTRRREEERDGELLSQDDVVVELWGL